MSLWHTIPFIFFVLFSQHLLFVARLHFYLLTLTVLIVICLAITESSFFTSITWFSDVYGILTCSAPGMPLSPPEEIFSCLVPSNFIILMFSMSSSFSSKYIIIFSVVITTSNTTVITISLLAFLPPRYLVISCICGIYHIHITKLDFFLDALLVYIVFMCLYSVYLVYLKVSLVYSLYTTIIVLRKVLI